MDNKITKDKRIKYNLLVKTDAKDLDGNKLNRLITKIIKIKNINRELAEEKFSKSNASLILV
jgi:hypothetical protein